MKQFCYSLFIVLISWIAFSCSGSAEDITEANLREAEMAIAQGDMTAAESAAKYIVGDRSLDDLTPRQLGRLSMIYIQLADADDKGDHVSRATDCYRTAFAVDSDSAAAFYNNVIPEHTAHAMLLSAIVHSTDIPTDSLHLDD
ncbi:MAG: hypothetical protein K2H84_00900 [Paramuribaculum sp.]|nr:hypothetical protein [Paramuribaculum sp.]